MNSFHKSVLPGADGSLVTVPRQVVIKYVLPDGARYSGEVVIIRRLNRFNGKEEDTSVPQGKGKIHWPGGDKYRGQFHDGAPNGEGIKTFVEDQTVIECTFINGHAQGEGRLTRPGEAAGLVYTGSFFADKQDGWGKEIWNNGNAYEGQFTKGKKGPKGSFKFGDGNEYEGEFKNDALSGKGKLTNDKKEMCYDGEWKDNKMHGYGVYKWHKDGRRYQGNYIDDKKHGFGVYKWENGRIYYGFWQNGHQHGEGYLVLPNMNMEKHYWEEGKKSTDALKITQNEKDDIIKYIKEMQLECQ